MTRRSLALSLLIAGMFSTIWVSADFDLRSWGLWREVRIEPKLEKSGYVQIELDGEVFAGARQDLADLRMVDQTGAEIPSDLVRQSDGTNEEFRRFEMLDRTLAQDGGFSFTLDLGEATVRHNRIRLITPAANFSRRVQIETSVDNRTWATARSDGYIFSFQRDTTAKYLSIDYPVSTRRYMRVTIFNRLQMKEVPIEITGAEVTLNADPEPQLTERVVVSQTQREDLKGRISIVTLDLGYPKVPSTSIEIQTPQTNFHRHIEIEGKQELEEDQKLERLTWSQIGSGEIYQVILNGYQTRNLKIIYPEVRLRYLRIKIFDYDDRSLAIDRIRVLSHPHRLLFRAEPGNDYRLFYGNATAAQPRYDLGRMIQYIDLTQVPVVGLGPQRGQAAARSIDAETAERSRPGWLLGTMIAAGLVLAYLIFRLAKKTVA